uniref:ML domain-containing protein n=3 Tax=Macrostomum lignano TaxID=282301 RepID=A0A1I8J6W6_9PLAT
MQLLLVTLALVAAGASAEQLQWKDCGSSSDIVKITDFGMRPYPPIAQKGFNFQLFVKGRVNRDFGEAKMNLKLSRKVLGFWVPIPCLAGYGSCTYDNGCQLMDTLLREASIPEIPDECPGIRAQNVDMANSITLPEIPGPLAWLVSGTYRARGEVIENGSNARVICMELEGRIED